MTTVVYSDIDIGYEQQVDGDIKRVTEVNAVKNSITNIINTMQGSRRMLPEFAADINKILFEPIDDVTARILGEKLIDAIEYWDDRVEITGIQIDPQPEKGMYVCRMLFKVKTTKEITSIDFVIQ